jgi:mannose-6-phosphate isomerase-like protein (cupin superfamily)
VESGKSVPSIRLLHRVALALEVSVPAFLREESVASVELLAVQAAQRMVSADGRVSNRSLFPAQRQRRAEFHEVGLAADASERLTALAPGSAKNLVVVHGSVEVRITGHVQRMGAGDALFFDADSPHSYRNPDPALPALLHVVTHFPESRRG